MHADQRMNLEELRTATREVVAGSGKAQHELAGELGVTQPAISRAVNEAAPKLAGLQRRIIEHLTDYRIEVEKTVEYVVRERS